MMAEAKVVQDLAEVCASGGEPYGAWTTAKAVVQRRYLSARAQGTFSSCAEYLTALTHVLRRHLRVDLARELIDDVLFQALDHLARKTAASSSSGAPSESLGVATAAAELLQRLFDILLAATTRTYTLTGPLPLKVDWNTEGDGDGVDVVAAAAAAASSTADALRWAEEVVLHFALRAVAFMDGVLPAVPGTAAASASCSAICIPWAENLYAAYEQLLALRLTRRQPSTPASDGGAAFTAPPSAAKATTTMDATPTNALVAPLLSLSALSLRSRAAVEGGRALTCESAPPSHFAGDAMPSCTALSQTGPALPTPVAAAVHWITHFAAQPGAVNRLFAQYIFHDVLRRGVQGSAGTAAAAAAPSASTAHDSAVAVLQRRCPLQQREAVAVARAAIAAYQQALPLVLQRQTSTRSSVATRTARVEGEEACDSTAYVQHYGWTWFLDSLTLTLQYSGAAASTTADADTVQRAKHEQVCAQVLDTYASVVAELPGLSWAALMAAYAAS